MEQINYVKDEAGVFTLSIFYNRNLYESKISEDDFDSDIIDLDYLDEIIQQGLRPNQVRKIDDHLSVITQITENEKEKTLLVTVQLVFKKGKLKKSAEKHSIILEHKQIDTIQSFENIMRDTEKSLNLPHVHPNTLNLFCIIDKTSGIYFVNESNQKIYLFDYIKMEFERNFLEYLENKFQDVSDFYQNKQKSQESIQRFNIDWFNKLPDAQKFSLLANYFSYTYYCNFISVIDHGDKIMLNVSLNKQPKETVYHVTDQLTTFNFNLSLHYRILSEFTLEVQNEVEICYTSNHGFLVYENKKLAKNKLVIIHEPTCYYIKTSSNGNIEKFLQMDQNTAYCGESNYIKSPSQLLKVLVNSSGDINTIYVDCCSGVLACTCKQLSTLPHVRILYQEPNEISTLY